MTIAFAAIVSLLFLGIGIGLYATMSAALLDELDTGLRFRAASVQADLRAQIDSAGPPSVALIEPNEALVQVIGPGGALLHSSLPADRGPILPPAVLDGLDELRFFEREVPGIADVARMIAVPAELDAQPVTIVVGASMADRADALAILTVWVAIAAPLAIIVSSASGWRVAGSALRPVEEMRREASAVSVSGLDRRLTVPRPDDELGRLARTLNDMLDRLHEAFEVQNRFLDTASHELRTPLAALKAELDLARSRPRSLEEANAALASASEETDRLARLANDLLALSRAHQGRLPVHRTEIPMRSLIEAAGTHAAALAAGAEVRLDVDAPQVPVLVDGMRVRQALDNLVDNAVRHSPPGGVVRVRGTLDGSTARIVIEDNGPGFPAGFTGDDVTAFMVMPENGAAQGRVPSGAGLGLAIVRAIVEGHGGSVKLSNRVEGGARVEITMAGASLAMPT